MERNKELHQKVNEANQKYDQHIQNSNFLESKNILSTIDSNFFNTSTTTKPQEKKTKKNKKWYWIGLFAFFLLSIIIILILL